MLAAIYDLTIDAASGFALDVQPRTAEGTAFSLTGCTAIAEIRKVPTADEALAAFTITVDVEQSVLQLRLTGAQTASLEANPKAAWDLFLLPPESEPIRLLGGKVAVRPAVSRIPS